MRDVCGGGWGGEREMRWARVSEREVKEREEQEKGKDRNGAGNSIIKRGKEGGRRGVREGGR